MNKTVVVELDQNGKEIFHTAGYEKYWISRVGMETVWLRKERVKEVVSVQETFAAMEFLEKPERGIVSAEISIRMKMIDESRLWTRVGYEIMMPDNGTDKKVVVTFTDEEKEKQSEAEYAEVIRERDNLILTISGGIAIYAVSYTHLDVYKRQVCGFLPYTAENILKLAFSMLGEVYGWGGSLDSRDCSMMVHDIFACFGICLPKDTTGPQSLTGMDIFMDLTSYSKEEKEQILTRLRPGAVLGFPGHVMIYLGKTGQDYYVISQTGHFYQKTDTGFEKVTVNSLSLIHI